MTIYGRMSCGFCAMARNLCEQKGFEHEFIDMPALGLTKEDVAQKLGRPVRTVPQILVGDNYVGGYDEFSRYVASRT
nr:GrxA family glutaredoxin [Marinobacter daqiaonensis]